MAMGTDGRETLNGSPAVIALMITNRLHRPEWARRRARTAPTWERAGEGTRRDIARPSRRAQTVRARFPPRAPPSRGRPRERRALRQSPPPVHAARVA